MIIYNTKESAEEARYNTGDMIVKVPGGYTIMSVKEYINWLVKQ